MRSKKLLIFTLSLFVVGAISGSFIKYLETKRVVPISLSAGFDFLQERCNLSETDDPQKFLIDEKCFVDFHKEFYDKAIDSTEAILIVARTAMNIYKLRKMKEETPASKIRAAIRVIYLCGTLPLLAAERFYKQNYSSRFSIVLDYIKYAELNTFVKTATNKTEKLLKSLQDKCQTNQSLSFCDQVKEKTVKTLEYPFFL